MAVYKDGDKWRVIYRYTNWNGERKQTQKRGFATKREAQAWEHEAMLKQDANLDMTFESFFEIYKADKIKRSQIQKQLALLRRTLREESHVHADAGQPLRIIPWSGQTKSGRDEIYAVLDGFLEQGADSMPEALDTADKEDQS